MAAEQLTTLDALVNTHVNAFNPDHTALMRFEVLSLLTQVRDAYPTTQYQWVTSIAGTTDSVIQAFVCNLRTEDINSRHAMREIGETLSTLFRCNFLLNTAPDDYYVHATLMRDGDCLRLRVSARVESHAAETDAQLKQTWQESQKYFMGADRVPISRLHVYEQEGYAKQLVTEWWDSITPFQWYTDDDDNDDDVSIVPTETIVLGVSTGGFFEYVWEDTGRAWAKAYIDLRRECASRTPRRDGTIVMRVVADEHSVVLQVYDVCIDIAGTSAAHRAYVEAKRRLFVGLFGDVDGFCKDQATKKRKRLYDTDLSMRHKQPRHFCTAGMCYGHPFIDSPENKCKTCRTTICDKSALCVDCAGGLCYSCADPTPCVVCGRSMCKPCAAKLLETCASWDDYVCSCCVTRMQSDVAASCGTKVRDGSRVVTLRHGIVSKPVTGADETGACAPDKPEAPLQ